MSLRKIIFWVHLVVGLVAGLVVAVMSFTGAAIAFEKEIISLAEKKVRTTGPSEGATLMSLDDLVAITKKSRPDSKLSAITIRNAHDSAMLLTFGRDSVYANPHTGALSEIPTGVRSFMRTMTEWHRWLGRSEQQRALGKGITGACNVAFLFLAISGIYLWWPRNLSWKSLRTVTFFNPKLSGKARDWNWHTVMGFWTAPVLVVLTVTGMVISYPWASNLVYKITGTEAPGTPGAKSAEAAPKPSTADKPASLDSIFAVAKSQYPNWSQITIRLGAPGPRRESDTAPKKSAAPITLSVKEAGYWPLFASTQLTFDSQSGTLGKTEKYSDYNTGRKVRTWMRFLHTGEALGWPGQLVAAFASTVALLLVWTGIALSFRRFFTRKTSAPAL